MSRAEILLAAWFGFPLTEEASEELGRWFDETPLYIDSETTI